MTQAQLFVGPWTWLYDDDRTDERKVIARNEVRCQDCFHAFDADSRDEAILTIAWHRCIGENA